MIQENFSLSKFHFNLTVVILVLATVVKVGRSKNTNIPFQDAVGQPVPPIQPKPTAAQAAKICGSGKTDRTYRKPVQYTTQQRTKRRTRRSLRFSQDVNARVTLSKCSYETQISGNMIPHKKSPTGRSYCQGLKK